MQSAPVAALGQVFGMGQGVESQPRGVGSVRDAIDVYDLIGTPYGSDANPALRPTVAADRKRPRGAPK